MSNIKQVLDGLEKMQVSTSEALLFDREIEAAIGLIKTQQATIELMCAEPITTDAVDKCKICGGPHHG